MSNTLKKNSFVIYDKTRKGFVTGYVEKGLLHGLVRGYVKTAKTFKTEKSAKEFVQKILKNLDFLVCKESYKQEILDYNEECFVISRVDEIENVEL